MISKEETQRISLGKEEFLKWRHEQNKCLLFFDDASKENLGVAGVGGIIFDPKGKEGNYYARGL